MKLCKCKSSSYNKPKWKDKNRWLKLSHIKRCSSNNRLWNIETNCIVAFWTPDLNLRFSRLYLLLIRSIEWNWNHYRLWKHHNHWRQGHLQIMMVLSPNLIKTNTATKLQVQQDSLKRVTTWLCNKKWTFKGNSPQSIKSSSQQVWCRGSWAKRINWQEVFPIETEEVIKLSLSIMKVKIQISRLIRKPLKISEDQ